MMKYILSLTIFFSLYTLASAQGVSRFEGYSVSNINGIVIQNSYPRGAHYAGPVKKNFNASRLVFFTRLINETKNPIEFTIHFTADSIPIPGSPDTFVKLFLLKDTMTNQKIGVFNYGVRDLKSFDEPTRFQRTLKPKEECLFNVAAIFYQTKPTAQNQDRGGNRAEFVLIGQELFYRMPPQVKSLRCGRIVFKR